MYFRYNFYIKYTCVKYVYYLYKKNECCMKNDQKIMQNAKKKGCRNESLWSEKNQSRCSDEYM